jgi:hypothetical protein
MELENDFLNKDFSEITENQKKTIKELNEKVKDFINKNEIYFDKKILKIQIEIPSNINELSLSYISKLMSENLTRIYQIQENLSSLLVIVNYIKIMKNNFISNFRKEMRKLNKKISNAEIERLIEENDYYFGLKYLIFIYEDSYYLKLKSLYEVCIMYKELLSREITLREIEKRT